MPHQVLRKNVFDGFDDFDSGRAFEDIEFEQCTFRDTSLSITRQPELRSIARRIVVRNCVFESIQMGPVVVEDVLIDNIRKKGATSFVWGAVYKHVTLRGRIDTLVLNNSLSPFDDKAAVAAFEVANRRYYEGVDWALDFREAEFSDITLRGIPGQKIIRDPATQCLVLREKAVALRDKWMNLPEAQIWRVDLLELIEYSADSTVLVACKRSRDLAAQLAGITVLRDVGIAEPE